MTSEEHKTFALLLACVEVSAKVIQDLGGTLLEVRDGAREELGAPLGADVDVSVGTAGEYSRQLLELVRLLRETLSKDPEL